MLNRESALERWQRTHPNDLRISRSAQVMATILAIEVSNTRWSIVHSLEFRAALQHDISSKHAYLGTACTLTHATHCQRIDQTRERWTRGQILGTFKPDNILEDI